MAYKPRRCGKRWLDGDCPAGVLAIIDHGDRELDRYDVLYADVSEVKYEDSWRTEQWMGGLALTDRGAAYHFEMRAHEVSAYRYRMKHRYTKWSTLPTAVKSAVVNDLAELDRERQGHG